MEKSDYIRAILDKKLTQEEIDLIFSLDEIEAKISLLFSLAGVETKYAIKIVKKQLQEDSG